VKCESLSEAGSDERYRVLDFWSEHRGFEIFRERFAEGFNQFDRQLVDELVEEQEFVGTYYDADGHQGFS